MSQFALIVVDGGMWSDPASFGPYDSEAAAWADMPEGAVRVDSEEFGEAEVVALVVTLGYPPRPLPGWCPQCNQDITAAGDHATGCDWSAYGPDHPEIRPTD